MNACFNERGKDAVRTYPKILSWHKVGAEIMAAAEIFVTEKLDGANMRVLVSRDKDLRFGSRDMELDDSDAMLGFFSGKPLAWWTDTAHRDAAYALLDTLGVDEVLIFGEIVGWSIQKRINYFGDTGRVEFFAFDLMVGDEFVPYGKFIEVCDAVGLPRVPLLFNGAPNSAEFAEIVNAVNQGELKSSLAKAFGNENAPAEGIVVRTEPLFYTSLGCLSIGKLKLPKFREIESGAKKEPTPYTVEGGREFVDFVNTFVTEGRLHNVLVRLKSAGVIEGKMSDLKHIVPAFWADLKDECAAELSRYSVDEDKIRHAVGKKVQAMYARMLSEGNAK